MAHPLTRFLIRRRDDAATDWLALHTRGTHRAHRRARHRLAIWDALLDTWTANGTRRP